MLNRVKLENFKAWQEADVRLGRITGFFGTNSGGKSSLLQFLLLLQQTRNATDQGLVLDFGGQTDLVKAVVVNATDSDWRHAADLLHDLGLDVEELCPHLPWIDGSTAPAGGP